MTGKEMRCTLASYIWVTCDRLFGEHGKLVTSEKKRRSDTVLEDRNNSQGMISILMHTKGQVYVNTLVRTHSSPIIILQTCPNSLSSLQNLLTSLIS